MSNKIKRIIYSKFPINDINCLTNLCTLGTGIQNSNNYLICDRNLIYYAASNEFYHIILQYVYNKGVICITDHNIDSGTVIVHNESLFYNLVRKNKDVTKYFVNNNELDIFINEEDITEEIKNLIYELKHN